MDPRLAAANTALAQGRKPEAAALLIGALTADPVAPPQIYALLLNLLLELGRYADGISWAEQAHQRSPKDYEILNLQGAFLRLTGRRAEAMKAFDRAIKLRPGELSARANRGHLLNDAKNGAAAEAVFTGLIRQHPKVAELHRALGVALTHQGKIAPAERCFRQAVSLDPSNVDAWLDMSANATQRGNSVAAVGTIEQAMKHHGAAPRLIRAKVALLLHDGQHGQAASYLRSLPPIHRDVAWFNHDLARSLMHSEPAEATRLHRRAIEAAPQNRTFRLAFAEHLLRNPSGAEGSHLDEAYRTLQDCLPTEVPSPTETRIRGQILARVADFTAFEEIGSFDQLGRSWAKAGLHTALLDLLARVKTADDRRALVGQHKLWGDRAIARARAIPVIRRERPKTSKIRIGFMSSDLRAHPVAYFAWPLFEHADRNQFEIYCYSFFRGGEPDPIQRRLATMVDSFRWAPAITDRDAAQMIADDDLDILFELGASTFMNKLEVMAWKPARICASWLGYPHSTGLATIDHLLIDPFLNPPDPTLLIEKPLIMPKSWIAMTPQAFPDRYPIIDVAPCRRNGFITFGTANNSYKFNTEMLRSWARTMKRVPNSRFLFVRPEVGADIVRRNLLDGFAAEGVSADRIEFRAVRGTHMGHYNDIDIALDTFPQTGGTTTCEALWMGVPTVSIVGEAVFERLSYSILNNAGLGDLCATTVEDFIDVSVSLAEDTDRLQALRTGLRDRIRTSPLGQTEAFARDFFDLVARTVEADAVSERVG